MLIISDLQFHWTGLRGSVRGQSRALVAGRDIPAFFRQKNNQKKFQKTVDTSREVCDFCLAHKLKNRKVKAK